MRTIAQRFLGIILLLIGGTELNATPDPSLAPVSWELKFTFNDPERIRLTLPGDDQPSTYWYILYRVENDTGQDIQFAPSAELVTSSLQVIVAGDQVSPTVVDAIRERHRTTHPFMVEPGKVIGPLLQGEDNAKSSLVVFRDFNPEDNEFTIFFGGLSGEIQNVPNPVFDRSQPDSPQNPRLFTHRKTLAIKYKLPGDAQTRESVKPTRLSREWMMR